MKRNLLSLLVLLMTAATGAVAQTETLLTTITATAKEQASYSTANVATVSFSYTAGGSSAYLANWGWWGYGWTATVNAAEGYTITKCVFYDDANRKATDSEAPFVVETTEEDKTPRINGTPIDGGNNQSKGIKKIEVYGCAPFNLTANLGNVAGEYWATFYSDASNFKASAGTQVFAVNLTGTAITMTEITDGIVNSGQGVVLKSTAASITMTPNASASAGDYSTNSLTGTTAAMTGAAGNIYVLNNGTQGVGFYKLKSTGTIGANKAYLTYSGSLAPEFFGFDGNTTSINEVRGKMEDVSGEYYDLQGRRVSQPTKGLYIVNGKKVVIK